MLSSTEKAFQLALISELAHESSKANYRGTGGESGDDTLSRMKKNALEMLKNAQKKIPDISSYTPSMPKMPSVSMSDISGYMPKDMKEHLGGIVSFITDRLPKDGSSFVGNFTHSDGSPDKMKIVLMALGFISVVATGIMYKSGRRRKSEIKATLQNFCALYQDEIRKAYERHPSKTDGDGRKFVAKINEPTMFNVAQQIFDEKYRSLSRDVLQEMGVADSALILENATLNLVQHHA